MRTLSPTYKLMTFIEITGCTESTAVAYLVAEEWDLTDALLSYRADAKVRA